MLFKLEMIHIQGENWFIFISCYGDFKVFSVIVWRDFFFLQGIFWWLYPNYGDHSSVDLFLSTPFIFSNLYI